MRGLSGGNGIVDAWSRHPFRAGCDLPGSGAEWPTPGDRREKRIDLAEDGHVIVLVESSLMS